MGDNYVLGTKDDEVQYEPYLVCNDDVFWGRRVVKVACGSSHVVVLTEEMPKGMKEEKKKEEKKEKKSLEAAPSP